MEQLTMSPEIGLLLLGFFTILLLIDWSYKKTIEIKFSITERKKKKEKAIEEYENTPAEPFSAKDKDFLDYN